MAQLLYPVSRPYSVRLSSLILRIYSLFSLAFCLLFISMIPKSEHAAHVNMCAFMPVIAVALVCELVLWVKRNHRECGVWKLIGAVALILFLFAFALLWLLLIFLEIKSGCVYAGYDGYAGV
jgi:hypothetical protein